jgi:hypothetical protein
MRAYEFLKEYDRSKRIKDWLMELKQKAIVEVTRVDDEYWLDKPTSLREKYKEMNRLPDDHPHLIDYLNDLEKAKSGVKRII